MNDTLKDIKNFFKNVSQEYVIEDNGSGVYPELISINDSESFVMEQYRQIAASLQKIRKEKGSKLFLFTSPQPQDGKTTTVSNLAVVLSKEFGKKVLIVDADLRRPRIHKFFNKKNENGLAEVLKKEEDILDYITETDIENLSLLLAGKNIPSNFLSDENLRHNLLRIKHEYDYVLVDSAPILKVTDAAVLGHIVDNVILIVRAQNTPSKLIKEAYELLKSHGSEPSHSVLVNHSHFVDLYNYCVNPHYRNYYSDYYSSYSSKSDDSEE